MNDIIQMEDQEGGFHLGHAGLLLELRTEAKKRIKLRFFKFEKSRNQLIDEKPEAGSKLRK
jgi:hypothetical protein